MCLHLVWSPSVIHVASGLSLGSVQKEDGIFKKMSCLATTGCNLCHYSLDKTVKNELNPLKYLHWINISWDKDLGV